MGSTSMKQKSDPGELKPRKWQGKDPDVEASRCMASGCSPCSKDFNMQVPFGKGSSPSVSHLSL